MTGYNLPDGCTSAEVDAQCGPDVPDRPKEADQINWKQAGEDAIRNMTEADKAEQLREWTDYRLAVVFDQIVRDQTNWLPLASLGTLIASDGLTRTALNELRDQQADLAEQHFLETGEFK